MTDRLATKLAIALSIGFVAGLPAAAPEPQLHGVVQPGLQEVRLAIERLPRILLATAKVEIDGQPVYFRYEVDATGAAVDLQHGYQSIDRGELITEDLSPWRAWGRGSAPVFRIGNRYVSTRVLDLEKRTVTVESRTSHDYRRLELFHGLEIPDFEFYDLGTTRRRLSEFRGKYVLLNVWYTGCTPCSDEFPYLRAALQRFGPDRLAVVGLSETGTPDEIRALGAAATEGWVEAYPPTARPLIWEWMQIDATPTAILLDPAGRVISVGREVDGRRPLRGAELERTLERMIRN